VPLASSTIQFRYELIKSLKLIWTLYTLHIYIYLGLQGAVLGPGEFFEGLALGGRQFVGGTLGKSMMMGVLEWLSGYKC